MGKNKAVKVLEKKHMGIFFYSLGTMEAFLGITENIRD